MKPRHHIKLMECQNFKWASDIEIEFDGELFDLHNCFDFASADIRVQEEMLVLTWIERPPMAKNWKRLRKFSLTISSIFYVRVEPSKQASIHDDRTCLSSFGFEIDGPDCDERARISSPPGLDEDWRWSFEFEDGREIVVNGASVVATLGFL